MTMEFICGTFCMLAILLLVVLIRVNHLENFANGSYNNAIANKLNEENIKNNTVSNSPDQSQEMMGATPSTLQGKNLPKTIDDATSNEAADIKSKQDSVAEMRRMIRSELQSQRRFQLPEEDLAYAEEDCNMNPGRKISPSLEQSYQYRANNSSECPGNSNSSASSNNSSANSTTVCNSSDYIKKDSIPCWGCSLPTSTD